MSHIIASKKQLVKVSYYLNSFDYDNLRKYTIEEIIKYLLPKDSLGKNLIDYSFTKSDKTSEFVPGYQLINFNIRKLFEWVEYNYKEYCKSYGINNPDLRKYLLLYCILHEMEHSYQYLIGNGDVVAPNLLVKDCYHELMDLLIKPESLKIEPIKSVKRRIRIAKYFMNENNYVLERNANIEAGSAIIRLADFDDKKDILKIFYDIARAYTLMGYNDDNMGCMYHTCKDLLLGKFYSNLDISDIKDEDRIRYGLEISKEQRSYLLKRF